MTKLRRIGDIGSRRLNREFLFVGPSRWNLQWRRFRSVVLSGARGVLLAHFDAMKVLIDFLFSRGGRNEVLCNTRRRLDDVFPNELCEEVVAAERPHNEASMFVY